MNTFHFILLQIKPVIIVLSIQIHLTCYSKGQQYLVIHVIYSHFLIQKQKIGRNSDYYSVYFYIISIRYLDASYYWRRKVREDNDGMNFVESVSNYSLLKVYVSLICSDFGNELTPLMSVLQIFSYVFGDGDPNQGIEKKRWKLVIIEHGLRNLVVLYFQFFILFLTIPMSMC